MSATGKLARISASAFALVMAAPPVQAESAKQVATTIDVAQTSNGWAVVRGAGDEKRARLIYSYPGKSPTRVEGSRDGSRWKFRIDEQVPATALVTLEFELLRATSKEVAAEALNSAAVAMAGALTTAFPKAVASASSSGSVNVDLLYASLGALIREQIATIVKTTKLGTYELDGRPAPDVLLEGLGFKQLGPKVWEPTTRTFELLSSNWGAHAKRLHFLNATISGQRERLHPCAGDVQAQAGNADARRRAALACLSVFAVSVREALKGVTDAKGVSQETATVTQHASRLENLGARLAQDPAAPLFAASTGELGEGFAIEVAADIGALANALALPPGAKLPKPDTFTPKREEAGKAMLAFQFVSAVEAEPAIRAALAKQQRDEIEKAVTAKFQDALVAERLTTQDYASEIFVLDKPKPRFFISTGVMAAAFNDDWQLALPIIASICVTTAGCETKGAGSGGNQGNYFSLDLGIKTVRIGGDDRREGAPSLLIGFGATPFYATHFSLGLNVFSNRQSDTPRANAAAYFAVTLDTIDGADILGSLGVGKPEVKPIGGTSAQSGN